MKLFAVLSVSFLSVFQALGSQLQQGRSESAKDFSFQQPSGQTALSACSQNHGIVLTEENMEMYTYRDPSEKILIVKKDVEEISERCFVSMPLKDFGTVWLFLEDVYSNKLYGVSYKDLPKNITELKDFIDLTRIVLIMKENGWTQCDQFDSEKITDLNLQAFFSDWLSKHPSLNPIQVYQKEIVRRGDPLKDWKEFVNRSLLQFVPPFLQGVEQIIFETEGKKRCGAQANQIKKIGRGAFAGCNCTVDLTGAEALQEIGEYAFDACDVIAKGQLSNIETIGHGAFYHSNISEIGLGPKLKLIDQSAFEDSHLKKITFAGNVPSDSRLTVEDCAFAGSFLKDIVFPANMEKIGADVFSRCVQLNGIDIQNCEVLKKIPAYFVQSLNIRKISIPQSVEIIGESAFFNCKELKDVSFAKQSKLTTIKNNAFCGTTALTVITLPQSLVELENDVFSSCTSLETVSFEQDSQLKKVGEYCFANTKIRYSQGWGWFSKLIPFVLPDSVEELDEGAFFNCQKLTEIKIPSKVKHLGCCDDSKDGEKITGVFRNCSALTKVEFNSDSQIESIGINTFVGTKIAKVSLPQTLRKICCGAFFNLESLQEVNFELNMDPAFEGIAIDQQAFFGCRNLKGITVPFCARLGKLAFSGCTNLSSVEFIYPLFKTLPVKCFSNCEGLEIFSIPSSVEKIEKQAFEKTNIKHLYVPSNVESIAKKTFFQNTNLLSLVFDPKSKVERIPEQCCEGCVNLRHCVFPSQLKFIETKAFSQCKNLVSRLFLPDSVEILGKKAFFNCKNLQSIVLRPSSLLKCIGISCFEGTSFSFFEEESKNTDSQFSPSVFPDSLEEIQDKAFFGTPLRNLTFTREVPLPENYHTVVSKYMRPRVPQLQKIGKEAFAESSLEGTIVFPKALTQIGIGCFANTKIQEIVFNENLEAIPDFCFFNCWLQHIDFQSFESRVVEIGKNAFSRNFPLPKILPENQTQQKKPDLMIFECCHSWFVRHQGFFPTLEDKEKEFYEDRIVKQVYLCKEATLFSAYTPFLIKTYCTEEEANQKQLKPSTFSLKE